MTLGVSTIVYLLLFLLYLRVIKPGRSWYQPTLHGGSGEREVPSNLWTVIWQVSASWYHFRSLIVPGTRYPITYWIQILPLSVVRQIEFQQLAKYGEIRTKPGWTFLVITLLGLTGVIDATLYRWTRSSIFVPRQQAEPEAPDLPANGEKESGGQIGRAHV